MLRELNFFFLKSTMSNWKKYKLGELYNVSSGLSKSRNQFGFGHPFVTFKDVFYNYFLPNELESLANTTDKEITSCSVKKGDIFLTRTSETANELGMSSVALKDYPKATFNGFTKRLRLKESVDIKIDPVFIGYYLRSASVRNQFGMHSSMSTRASLNNDAINTIEIKIPDIEPQIKIAKILKSLDDKRELNRRMNQTLEQMAQALFNHYFVDNIEPDNLPEGWKIGKVGEVLELKYGKALKENQRRIGNYAVVGSGGIIGYHNEFICKGKGIVVGRKGNSGAVSWLHESFYPIDTTFYVSDLIGVKDLYYYYFLLKSLNLKNLNSDSAVPGLNRNEAHNQEIVIPDNKKINEFNNSVSSFFNRININLNQIKTLTTIRDTLLPKLMSGEIDVDTPMKEETLFQKEATKKFKTA